MAFDVLSTKAAGIQPVNNNPVRETMNLNVVELSDMTKANGFVQAGKNEQGNGQGNGQKEITPSKQFIKNEISLVNTKLKHQRTRCEFAYNEATRRVSIKVLDEDTEEVIKEIPPEETLEMIAKLWELAGILVDERR